MTEKRMGLAHEIRELSAKLATDGWDRMWGLRLIHAATSAMDEARRNKWLEGVGRADALIQVLGEFIRESPSSDRLEFVLNSANALAHLLQDGRLLDQIDRGILPPNPGDWTFFVLGESFDPGADFLQGLDILGFVVEQIIEVESLAARAPSAQTVLLAGTAWIAENAIRLATILPKASEIESSFPILVAVADTTDFRSQAKARQTGARLLFDAPLDVSRLITELAGLAWMPRAPYRILLVDDDASVLEMHALLLRNAGFDVFAVDDPVTARDFLNEIAPDVCILDIEMPACRGTDLAALFRRDKRFARLPVIYLSAFADIEHQLDARFAGGEDYLIKPVDTRLLVAAVMAQARMFRAFGAEHRQRQQAWRQMKNLRIALDAHAIVSASSPDGSIVDANCKFCEISGFSREELIGRNHRIVKSGRHPPAYFQAMWETITSGRIWQGEMQNRHKDGSHYWTQSTIVPIFGERGRLEQYISISTDITEQKRVQTERERQARLLDAIRHSLQNFIVSLDLSSTSSLLLETMLLLTESTYGFIGEVLHEPDETPYLRTHALSNIAWNEKTKLLYEQAQIQGMEFRNLDTLFGAVLRTGEPVIANDPANDPRRGGLPEGHPPLDTFLGIPIHYGKTLIGMVGMANRPSGYDPSMLEFLAPLVATYATILEAARLRYFQKQVINDLQRTRDTAEQANRAKTEFIVNWCHKLRTPLNAILGHTQILLLNERLDADAAEQSREIFEGGEQIASQINSLIEQLTNDGTSPTQPTTASSLTVAAMREDVRPRILVAEDNPANQAVLRMQLDVLGFAADIAADGSVALAKWQAGGHDLILADRNMPDMDGLELARAIRATERNSGAYVPIIAITAIHHSEELALCLKAGMDEVLTKPIELDNLRRVLERWLPHSSPVAQSDRDFESSTRASGKTLDINYLARIIGNTDAKQARELVDLFTATVHKDLPACRQHLAEHNGRSLALLMHKLKSSARMVGALRFADLAEALEDVAKVERLEAAAALISELEHGLADVESAASKLDFQLERALGDIGAVQVVENAFPGHILVVDDDPVARRQITLLLSTLGVREVLAVDGALVALAEISRQDSIDLIISDLNMPGMDGIEFLRRLAENGFQGCLILCSGVEEQLLQTAAEVARAKGMSLRGTLRKPVSREMLLQLLTNPCKKALAPSAQGESISVSPSDILEGIRHNEFDIHFQPKVDAATLCVVGVEALARWQRNGSSIPPDAFIGVAERHELIRPLSEVLLTKALVGGARLVEAGFPLVVSVNLSANWLADIHLPEFILASIQATGFKAENLILEITETGVMADMTTALDVMTRLRLKGFKLSIDDFGTGYSSLEQLQRIPFGELKLDRGFVRGAAEKPSTRAILASSIEMAMKLNLVTVAEGVETQADLDLVRGLGCDLVQGWFIARAMALDQLLKWLRDRNL